MIGQASIGVCTGQVGSSVASNELMLNMNEPTVETAGQFTMVSGKSSTQVGILTGVIGNQAICKHRIDAVLAYSIREQANQHEWWRDARKLYRRICFGYWFRLWCLKSLSAANLGNRYMAAGFKMKIRVTTTITTCQQLTSIYKGCTQYSEA